MKFRIRYADKVVGLFVVLALLVLAAGIILLGANQRWFSRDFRFTTRLNSAAGAAPGTPIYLKGFQVGKIESLRLNDRNEVDADFAIFDTYYPKVRGKFRPRTRDLAHRARNPAPLRSREKRRGAQRGSFVPLADSLEGRDLIDQELVDIPPKDDTITRHLGCTATPPLENLNKTVVTGPTGR